MGPMTSNGGLDGWLVIDKPLGITSNRVVEVVRRRTGGKVGHAGTLDPLATGVLPICVGEATKLAGYMLAEDKEYIADAVLGVETDTLDRSGTVIARADVHVTRDAVIAALAARTGEHDQIPPMFSAIKQGGVRLYKRARAGEEVDRPARRVRIDRLELLELDLPRVRLAIACSKGTYVRSLIDDLGRDLGCGAHMAELRRTRAGIFTIEMAQRLDALDPSRMVPLASATQLHKVMTPPELVQKIRDGLKLPVELFTGVPAEGERFQLIIEPDSLLAVSHADGGKLVYDRVFHLDVRGDLPQSPP
jgi:tRNA pseudouridine55 synthase